MKNGLPMLNSSVIQGAMMCAETQTRDKSQSRMIHRVQHFKRRKEEEVACI